nr:hypothetical protein [Tanacetum cinerariifolium]
MLREKNMERCCLIPFLKAFKDLTPEEKIRKECDIRAGNIILYGLPNDIYTLLNQKMIAYEIWGKGTRNTKVVRIVGYLNANPLKVIKCYNCRGRMHYAKQYTSKKRVKDSEWFKEKMLLAQQQEAGIEISDEQQDFLVDGLEGFDSDYEELQLNATSILMIEKVDAYDSEVDDAPNASAIFMEKLSPAGSINGDEVGPS